jgi:hypothetical protein
MTVARPSASCHRGNCCPLTGTKMETVPRSWNGRSMNLLQMFRAFGDPLPKRLGYPIAALGSDSESMGRRPCSRPEGGATASRRNARGELDDRWAREPIASSQLCFDMPGRQRQVARRLGLDLPCSTGSAEDLFSDLPQSEINMSVSLGFRRRTTDGSEATHHVKTQ